MTQPITTPTLLRTALRLDAAASGGMGLALVVAAGALAAPLGLPEPLLRGAGLALLPWAALVAGVGARPAISRGAAAAIVAVNALWVLASVLLLVVDGAASPTALGVAFVVAQALAVLGFAEAQWMGLRRVARAADGRHAAVA